MRNTVLYDRKTQRIEIQELIDGYFGKPIDISPRAMAALQGRWSEQTESGKYEIPALSIFEGLITSSPSCLILLLEAGLEVEKLFYRKIDDSCKEGPALLMEDALDWIFFGNPDRFTYYQSENTCLAANRIFQKQSLTELDLLSAFLQTAYRGPEEFHELVDADVLSPYLTDVGDRLIEAGHININDAIELDFEESNSYRESKEFFEKEGYIKKDFESFYIARSITAKFFKELSKRIDKVTIADPSHDRLQFAVWMDPKGLIRVNPFGVGSLGLLEATNIKKREEFIFREGIFQPVSSICPGINEDTIFELEGMMNSQSCSEQDFQRFFERYPEMLMGLDYKEIHPQLVLYNDEGYDLIPDFMLEPMSSEFCDLLELKLPYEQIVTSLRKMTRIHFKAFINEAISQLLEYRRYFEEKSHRKDFYDRFGLKVYYPKMILVVGRRHHFKSDSERQELNSILPKDLELWTYDFLLSIAKKYFECFSKIKCQ